MRFAPGLLALCACNQVYGLAETRPEPVVDAQYFDAPVDAPFACPPLTAPPPSYSRFLRQIPQDCRDYSLSFATGVATARCFEPRDHVAVGPIDELLGPIAGMTSDPGGVQYVSPQLAPEGDELFYLRVASPNGRIEHRLRNSDGTWATAVALTPNLPVAASLGTPTRGTTRRMMVKLATTGTDLSEIEIAPNGTWSTVATYGYADLGVYYATSAPSLSPDGLRLVWSGQDIQTVSEKTYYATRPSLSARFESYAPLVGVPGAVSPFMTEDCAKIYFSAAASVLYVQQQ